MHDDHDRASGTLAADAEAAAVTVQDTREADVLSDVLQAVRLNGALFFLVDARPPWSANAPASDALGPVLLPRVQHIVSYHVIIEGDCWCRMAGEAPLRLEAGDVIVVPHGDAYALSSAADPSPDWPLDETLAWFRRMSAPQRPCVVREGGGGAGRIEVFCGFLGCDALPFNPVLATLPRLLHVRRVDAARDRLASLVDFAVSESRDDRAGSRSVLLRVGELMFVEVVRRHLTALGDDARGWLAGLRDPLIGRALARLHAQPQHPWTTEALAREVASSRSVLAERFTHLVGEPPMHYLTRWRIQVAAARLASGDAKIAAVARDVGYDSEAAFSRAFKKLTGVAPSKWPASPA